MDVKIALDPAMRGLIGKGLLAAAVPQAYAAYEAPDGARLDAMRSALKGTALASIPTAMIFGKPEASMASGIAGGIKGADNAIQAHKSRSRSHRIEALVEALGKKFVPAKTWNQIDGLPKASEDTMDKRALLYVLSKLAIARKLAGADDSFLQQAERSQQAAAMPNKGMQLNMMGGGLKSPGAAPAAPPAPGPAFSPQQTQAAASVRPATFGGTPATIKPGPAMFNPMTGAPR